MTMYRVKIPETRIAHMRIEAESEEAAIEAIANGDGSFIELEFGSTSNPVDWTVEEE